MEFDIEEQRAQNIWMGKFLHSMGVSKIEASLSGGGDSGDIDDICYSDHDGKNLMSVEIESVLEKMTIDDGSSCCRSFLDILRDDIVTADASDMGNWYDNDGGNVWISYAVTADGMGIDGSVFDYNEAEPDEDEDDVYDDEFPEGEDEEQEDHLDENPEP